MLPYLLAFAGFAALIVLHEFGHFIAAKAVGMRVERFALFFPPLLFKVRRGETEYGIGAIPLGGYVRISGMNPHEELPPEVQPRAYYRQHPWKRIVVILAGPVMNILIALAIFSGILLVNGKVAEDADGNAKISNVIADAPLREPAKGVLQAGDRILAVDGVRGGPEAFREQIQTHGCRGPETDGCVAETAARLLVDRDGAERTFALKPVYDAVSKGMRLGFSFDVERENVGLFAAIGLSVEGSWRVTKATVQAIGRIFDAEKRKEISGAVGSYEVTRQSFASDVTTALNVLAIISLSLAIVNLFPFLPLDGGHVFWAAAEWIRRKPIPFSILERASVVGFFLVMMLFVVGLTNDIDRLRGEGFEVR